MAFNHPKGITIERDEKPIFFFGVQLAFCISIIAWRGPLHAIATGEGSVYN